ncbi:MAG: hypothetical protein ABEJ40_00850 [Haloarculaceae archaeon]
MVRDELASARDRLESAAENASDPDAADRLDDLAGQLDTLATRERGPDHGRLARIENALDDLTDDVDAGTADTIDAAHEDVVAFRETVEGV